MEIDRRPHGFFNTWDNFKGELDKFIEIKQRPPTVMEVIKDLHINSSYIKQYGGFAEIKRKMNWSGDCIDLSGYYNESSYEMQVANVLIMNNIPYTRQDRPFPNEEGRYKCDFAFHLDNSIIYCEVWGYSKENKSNYGAGKIYNSVRIKKEKLYKKYDMHLISVEPNIFLLTYEKMQNEIIKCFSVLSDYKINKIEQRYLIPSNKLSDEEILKEIMVFSDNPNMLPSTNIISKEKFGLYSEIIKRYGSYFNFAKAMKKNVMLKMNYWTLDIIMDKYFYIYEKHNKIFTTREILQECKKDDILRGLMPALREFGGVVVVKLEFYKRMLLRRMFLNEKDIKLITEISQGKKHRGDVEITQEIKNTAKELLEQINKMI